MIQGNKPHPSFIPYTNNKSKGILQLNVRTKTIKLQEENRRLWSKHLTQTHEYNQNEKLLLYKIKKKLLRN